MHYRGEDRATVATLLACFCAGYARFRLLCRLYVIWGPQESQTTLIGIPRAFGVQQKDMAGVPWGYSEKREPLMAFPRYFKTLLLELPRDILLCFGE